MKLFSKIAVSVLSALLILPACAQQNPAPKSAGFVHPGLPLTKSDLATLKVNLDKEPWKSGYAQLTASPNSSLDYKMQGPFEQLSRTPNVHLGEYRSDMQAVYNLARMWVFTGNPAYAQKGRDILLAWATTHKSWGGAESYLTMGDFAYRMYGGADLLRGTWPGWTQADTDTCKKYFLDVYWWQKGDRPLRSANQGALQLVTCVGIAVFCDDREKFDECVRAFRFDANGGLANSLSNGEIGDYGRDQGHSYGQLMTYAWIAEVFYKQGVDVYSDLDNRLLAAGEHYARYNLGTPTPWVPFGTKYDYFWKGHGGEPEGAKRPADVHNMLIGAYVVRKGMSAPFMTQYRDERGEDMESFVFRKSADTSTAKSLPPLPVAPTAPITSGFLNADVGGATPAGSATFQNGTWTVRGAGQNIWGRGPQSYHFTYKQVTGDFTFIARLKSFEATDTNANFGVMMSDGLQPDAKRRVYLGFVRRTGAPPIADIHLRGFTGASHDTTDEMTHDGPPEMLPHWFKFQRIGSRITIFHSADGANWTPGQSAEYDGWTDGAYVGLVVCSRVGGELATATLTDVRITGGDGKDVPQIPAAPFAVYASPGDKQVPLRWLESFGATDYKIKRAARKGGPYQTLVTLKNTSFLDKTVANGTPYFYVVSAVNGAGESAPSLEDSATPKTPSPPLFNAPQTGTASASAQGLPNEVAAKAFDGGGAKWYSGSNSGTTGWLQYEFDAAYAVRSYHLTRANDTPGRDPKEWQFQGSNDGTNWTTLDTQNAQVFTGRGQTLTFNIPNTTAFRFYRLNVLAIADATANSIQLAELGLRGYAP